MAKKSRRSRITSGFSRAGGFLGLKSVKDVGEVAVTASGSNYLASVVATAVGMSSHRFLRPLIATALAYFMSRKTIITPTVIGAILISLAQAGFNIPILSNMTNNRIVGGTTNPERGQQNITQLNTLGRLP